MLICVIFQNGTLIATYKKTKTIKRYIDMLSFTI